MIVMPFEWFMCHPLGDEVIASTPLSTLPYPALSCPALPYPALPCTALHCPTLPYPPLPYPTLPYPALPYPTLPFPSHFPFYSPPSYSLTLFYPNLLYPSWTRFFLSNNCDPTLKYCNTNPCFLQEKYEASRLNTEMEADTDIDNIRATYVHNDD